MILRENTKEKVNDPASVAAILKSLLDSESELDRDKEHFWAIGLNTNNTVKYVDLVALGCLDRCIVHPREVFRLAVLKGVARILIAHNHPSGTPEASPDDRALTEKLRQAGQILMIDVLDHVVLCDAPQGFITFKEMGLL